MNERSKVAVIRMSGELDVARKEELRHALVIDPAARAILLDLSGATYADSTVLTLLLQFYQTADAQSVPVAIVATAPQFVRLIRYAGLQEVFAIYADRGEALAYMERLER